MLGPSVKPKSRVSLVTAVVVAAYLSAGVWATFTGAAEHLCIWLMLAVAGLWAILLGLGLLPERRADTLVFWTTAAVAAVASLSTLASDQPLYAALYDSYAYMPLVIWLALLASFLMASKMPFGQDIRRGLVGVVLLSALPLSIGLAQSIRGGFSGEGLTVYGNSNFFVSVTVMLAVIALGLACTSGSLAHRNWWRVYAAVMVLAVLAQRTLIGYIAVPVAAALAFAVDPGLLGVKRHSVGRTLRAVAGALVALVALALIVASVPALNGGLVTPEAVKSLGTNAMTRVDLWRGAQKMFSEHSLLGLGPGGYKLHSIAYIDPWPLGAIAPNEPLDVSPGSPHSIFWTIGTTFGALGLVAMLALGLSWLRTLLRREDASEPAHSLRLSLAVAFGVYVIALLTVPISPAQGLLPAVVAGLAIAQPRREEPPGWRAHPVNRVLFVFAGALAVLLALTGAASYLAYWSLKPSDVAGSLRRFETAQSLQPGDPLYRFRSYEYRFSIAASPSQAATIRSEFMDESGVLKVYAPGLVELVQLSLDEAERDGRTDLSWERQMLIEARAVGGVFPNLVAQELRLAAMSGDEPTLKSALAEARKYQSSYPLLDAYVKRVEAALKSTE